MRARLYGLAGFILGGIIAAAWISTINGLLIAAIVLSALKIGHVMGKASRTYEQIVRKQQAEMTIRGPR